jgi:hypothetical protein
MPLSARRQPARILLTLLLIIVLTGLLIGLPGREPASTAVVAKPKHHEKGLSLSLLPSVRHFGRHPAPSTAARSLVNISLHPAGPARSVRLERRTGAGWLRVATSQLARGQAQFRVRAHLGVTYRAVVPAYRSLPRVTSAPVAYAWGEPDFVDEFDGVALGPAWEHRIQFYNPWGGRACSKGDPAAVAVGGGLLHLSSMVDPAATSLCPATDRNGKHIGHYPYRLNGHVSTQQSADFLYGVAAARMRFPKSLGQHAAFWLQPRGLLDTGTTPWGAEIDVVEWYGAGRRSDRMASAVHEPMPGGAKRQIGGRIRDTDRFLASRSDEWWTRFHVFSVEWTPREYIFRIGAHEVWRTSQGVSHVPEFLILSMLSSDFELPSVGNDAEPRTAEVDWVAFWEAS